MILDGFQYLLDDFWNFQFVTKIWTFSFLYVEMLRAIQENRWKHYQTYFSYLIILEIQKNKIFGTIGYKKCGTYLQLCNLKMWIIGAVRNLKL